MSLAELPAEAYDVLRAPLPELHVSLGAPASGALLDQLGLPEGWTSGVSPSGLFGPLIREAAAIARRISLGDPDE